MVRSTSIAMCACLCVELRLQRGDLRAPEVELGALQLRHLLRVLQRVRRCVQLRSHTRTTVDRFQHPYAVHYTPVLYRLYTTVQ